jgi:hypothetical protein
MATSPGAMGQGNKVVVAYLDGRRLKGYIFDFSAAKDHFRLLPEEAPLKHQGSEVLFHELKAVFFVKDFIGNKDYQESQNFDTAKHGRRIEVTFKDGETFAGTTEGYNAQKLGFFVFPTDPKSNNIRIFVVNKNVNQVKML